MQRNTAKTVLGSLFCAAMLAATSGAYAADKAKAAPGDGNPNMNSTTQAIWDNPDLTIPKNGVRTLEDYIVEEKELWDWMFKNHPVFKYASEGRIVGMYKISSRGSEYLGEGNAKGYTKAAGADRPQASQYRLPQTSILDFPTKFVGPEKCGQCHAVQYQKWKRSRHAQTVRFPGEHPEVDNDLKKKLYGSQASILADGITPDVIYATLGTPRTKYGYIDGWLARGSYHVRDGLLKDGTGTIVAGGNQFSRGWAQWLTPERTKEIKKIIPDFPTDMKGFGGSGSHEWGMTSYGASYEKQFLFQPATSYCEVCHSFKFDFKNKQEFFAALGNPKELQKHTISRGVACEECHGAGGHLTGAVSNGFETNCERCHQRSNFVPDMVTTDKDGVKKIETGFNVKTKSSCPSCGTEGSQLMMSKHYEKGMRCVTCHDPHEVTSNDWKSYYTKPAIRKTCQDCHKTQSDVVAKTDTHAKVDCIGCHMPFTMSCENFTAIQRPDFAGFDAVRRSHVWNIKVDPTAKMMNPGEGQSRASNSKGWRIAKDEEGHGYLDLMWSCARTANAEKEVTDNKGCHSPFLSELEKGLQYTDQKVIYDEVMKWQNPVKAGYDTAVKSIERINKLLEITKLSAESKTEVLMLLDKAQDIVDQIAKDGSWGVHAPHYLAQRTETAQAYLAQAQKLLDGGEFVKTKAAK